MHSVDVKEVKWPARKLSIGDTLKERIVYQVGSKTHIPSGSVVISSITEDKKNNSYIVCVEDPKDETLELPWKVIKNPSKMVEIEYDLSNAAYPKEA